MKLFAKIFICTIAVITAALAVVGYVMISGSFKNAMEHEYENAEAEYQLVKFALQSGMLSNSEDGSLTDEALIEAAKQTVSVVQRDTKIMVLSEDGTAVCSTFVGFLNLPGVDNVGEGKVEFHTGAETGSERL